MTVQPFTHGSATLGPTSPRHSVSVPAAHALTHIEPFHDDDPLGQEHVAVEPLPDSTELPGHVVEPPCGVVQYVSAEVDT